MIRSATMLLFVLCGCADTVPAVPANEAGARPAAPASRTKLLPVGAKLPPVRATAHDGRIVDLSTPRTRALIVYFYPKDETPGCAAEAEAFRDGLPAIELAGAEVVGVSVDSLESHRAFAQNRSLNFPLLSDGDGAIAGAFGVSVSGGFAERVTFVVARDGTIARVYPKVRVDGHVDEVIAAIHALEPRP